MQLLDEISLHAELCTVEVYDVLFALSTPTTTPLKLVSVRVLAPHHASKFGLDVIVLGLFGALLR